MNAKSNEHQTAIVTGASSGIGLGITQALLERGYRVVGNSRSISKSKELKASANLVLIDGDISQKDTAVRAAEAAVQNFGRIDLLVNNAGIYMPKPFLCAAVSGLGRNLAGERLGHNLAAPHDERVRAQLVDVVGRLRRPQNVSMVALDQLLLHAEGCARFPELRNQRLEQRPDRVDSLE
jgi:NAD(P)-dependent dehydrogenase (short-subunit alcohol dehydrogenase family)